MKTSLKFLFPIAILLLSGCAEVVKKNYGSNRGGTVKYNTGWFMADKNRAKAVEEMKAYCAPARPQLLSEDTQREFTGQAYSSSNFSKNSADTTTTQGSEKNIYMHFKCVKSVARR